MNIDEILECDRAHVWHPYASIESGIKLWNVESANGATIRLSGVGDVIDGMSSWWAVAYGYNNPKINSALISQLGKMSHVMFGGLTHEGAVRLAKRLVSMLPKPLDRVFFCDSGSVSVEVAMKMALQYWHAKGAPEKKKFATIRGGYHGDTWNAMSVCDPVGGMHSMFAGRLPVSFFAPRPKSAFGAPWNADDASSLECLFAQHSADIAAFILEPVVQGAGGMYFYNPRYLTELKALCKKYGVLLIFDEIATGFGRSGRRFACEWAGESPDIMCLGKAITGGYMSFAATIASSELARTISSGSPGLFMHGPTFMANPLACAAANAALDIFENGRVLEDVARIEKALKRGLEPLRGCAKVADVRVLGAIGVVEMKELIDIDKTQRALVERGVWLRPFGKLLYTMPPYVTDDGQLETLTAAMRGVATL